MAYLRNFSIKFSQIIFLTFPMTAFADWSDANMPVGVTEVSREIFDLHMLIFWVCVWIGVVVFGIMLILFIYCIFIDFSFSQRLTKIVWAGVFS